MTGIGPIELLIVCIIRTKRISPAVRTRGNFAARAQRSATPARLRPGNSRGDKFFLYVFRKTQSGAFRTTNAPHQPYAERRRTVGFL
jgi:hypothetical protein